MKRFLQACIPLIVVAVFVSRSAHAGDRGLYLHFLAEDPTTADPVRDELEKILFQCGEHDLAQCRRVRSGGDVDTGLNWMYSTGAEAAAVELRSAAFARPRGIAALKRWLKSQDGPPASMDGVILYQRRENAAPTLLFLNFTTGGSLRIAVRLTPEGRPQFDERARARAHRVLARGWVP